MNKRQAKLIAQLLTASNQCNADFICTCEDFDYLGESNQIKIQEAYNDLGWGFLAKHGFRNAPTVRQIIAYAKANY